VTFVPYRTSRSLELNGVRTFSVLRQCTCRITDPLLQPHGMVYSGNTLVSINALQPGNEVALYTRHGYYHLDTCCLQKPD